MIICILPLPCPVHPLRLSYIIHFKVDQNDSAIALNYEAKNE